MRRIQAGEFKARCLAVMKKVQATGEPVLVTKRGKPIVKVVPAESQTNELFGFMAGEFEVLGDIQSPLVPLKQWKVLKK